MSFKSLVLAGMLVLAATAVLTRPAAAQSGTVVDGVVISVETDESGALTLFRIMDGQGRVHELEVQPSTQYGLENQAGDRWVSSQADEPAEAARRLLDHMERFAPVTVTVQNGTAASVVERESGGLETSLGFLFAVYTITWAAFFAYIFYMSRKQRELQREVARLRGAMDAAASIQSRTTVNG